MNKSKNKHIQNYLNDSKKSINDQLQSLRQHHPAIKHTNNIDIANSLKGNSEGADLSRIFLGSLDMGANAQLRDLEKHLMHTRLTRENELLEEQQLSEQTSKFFKSNQSEIGTLIEAFQNHQDDNVKKIAIKLYTTLKQQIGDNTPITDFDPKNLVFTQYDPDTNQEEYLNFGDLVKNLAEENLPEEYALRLTAGINPLARDVLQQKQQAIGLELANKQADIDLKRAHAEHYRQETHKPNVHENEQLKAQEQIDIINDEVTRLFNNPDNKISLSVLQRIVNTFASDESKIGYTKAQTKADTLFKDLKDKMYTANPSLKTDAQFKSIASPNIKNWSDENIVEQFKTLMMIYNNKRTQDPNQETLNNMQNAVDIQNNNNDPLNIFKK